jgi:hypothetical protein
MEFGCSCCEYTSLKKENILKHFHRKKSCGPGIKEVVEIPIDISCEYCKKDFSSSTSLKFHLKNSCKNRKDQLEDENKKLKEKVKELEKQSTTTINNDNRTTNNTFNIFIVNNYEDTKLDKLTDAVYNNIISGSDEIYHIIPRLIKHIHFNPDIPENHNIVLSNKNKNNKHLQVYRGGHWEIEPKDNEIDNLIYDKETNLSDWIGEKGEKYPEAQEKFNEYLDQRYEDGKNKLIKEQVELVLYNNRHMVKT